jgi:long-chain acyl-CoA synthetase
MSLKSFDADVTELAASLMRLGIGVGARVALLMPASIDALACFFAVLRAGGAAVPVGPLTPAGELGRIFEAAKVSAVIAITAEDDPRQPLTVAVRDSPRPLVVITVSAGTPLSSAVRSQAAPRVGAPESSSEAGRPAAIFCTTGTTGRPRTVVHTHRGLVASVRALHAVHHSYFRGSGPEIAVRLLRLARLYRGRLRQAMGRHTWLTPMPFHSIAGMRFMVQAILTGQRLVIVPSFRPRALVEIIERERVNILALTPTMLEAVLTVRVLAERNLSSLIAVGLGGAPARTDLIRRGTETLGCPVLNGYGSTETAGGVLVTRVGDDCDGSVGYPFPGTEVVVVDDSGRSVPPGTVGELLCRTTGLMAGYGSDEPMPGALADQEDANVTPDGWFRTGDLARIDSRGAVHIVGRSRDLIIRGGMKIVPVTVENVLVMNSAVRAAAVVGVPDPVAGERIVAFVVARDRIRAADVLASCRGRLSPHEMPDHVLLVPELPRAESGEVRKVELRALASRQIARQHARRRDAKEVSAS